MVQVCMSIPWTEKYRPSSSGSIVLDEENVQVLQGILTSTRLPHLLLHGPPGTGKTTSAIEIVKRKHGSDAISLREMVIHLNASDERGIAVVKEQIEMFSEANSICGKHGKIIILDEVDYMTKNAQAGLKVLMERLTANVSMILVCNYIQKIPACLRSHFIHIRFNAPPVRTVRLLLHDIMQKENVVLTEQTSDAIIDAHYPDIRSMINTLQTIAANPGTHTMPKLTLDNACELTAVFRRGNAEEALAVAERTMENTGLHATVVIRDYIKHIARNTPHLLTTAFMRASKTALRIPAEEESTAISYFTRVAIPTLAFKDISPAS